MKKFEIVTDYEILNAAYFYYLTKWDNEMCYLEKNPDDIIAKSRVPKLRKILDEMHVELLKLKNY